MVIIGTPMRVYVGYYLVNSDLLLLIAIAYFHLRVQGVWYLCRTNLFRLLVDTF